MTLEYAVIVTWPSPGRTHAGVRECTRTYVRACVWHQCYKKADYGDTGDQDATSASQGTSD